MKIHDVITESELQQLDEAPAGMGMFGRAGRKIASKLGHTKSTGVLDAGNDAIALRKEFNRYLGKTGQQPNSEALMMFLQSSGYPTQGVEKIIAGHDAGAPTGVLGKGSSNISAFRDKMAQKKAAAGGGGAQQKIEPTGNIEVPPGGETPAAGGGAADTPAGFAPKANVSVTDPSGNPVPTGVPSTTDPLSRIKSLAGVGGSTSATAAEPAAPSAPAAPGAKLDPEKAAALKDKLKNKQGIAATSGTGFKTAKADATARGIKNFESIGLGEEGEEAKVLPSSVIDQALLRAVQDSYKLGAGQNINTGASGTTPGLDKDQPKQGIMGKFGAGFKAGMSGDTSGGAGGGSGDAEGGVEGSLNARAMAQLLPGVDPTMLATSVKSVMTGGNLSMKQQQALATAFTALIKADPQTTTKVMNMLKRVSAPGAAG